MSRRSLPSLANIPAAFAAMSACSRISLRSCSFSRRICRASSMPIRRCASTCRSGRAGEVVPGHRGGLGRDRHLFERDRDARLRNVSLSLRQSGAGDARRSSARFAARACRSPIRWTSTMSACTRRARSTCARNTQPRRRASRSGLRIHVPGFDAVCRMVQANMGIGMIPDRAFDVVGAGMGLRAIRLRDKWARRQLKIAVRNPRALSGTGRLVFEHLRDAERARESRRCCADADEPARISLRSAETNCPLAKCDWTPSPMNGQSEGGPRFAIHHAADSVLCDATNLAPKPLLNGQWQFGPASLYWCGWHTSSGACAHTAHRKSRGRKHA